MNRRDVIKGALPVAEATEKRDYEQLYWDAQVHINSLYNDMEEMKNHNAAQKLNMKMAR